MKVEWSPRAQWDLLRIVDYIRQDSPTHALEFSAQVESKVLRLGLFPRSGRMVPELQQESNSPHEIIIGDYRLLYRIHENKVEIAAFFHGMRRPPKLSEQG